MIWDVSLKGARRDSQVIGGRGALTVLGERGARLAAQGRRAFMVTDENVWRALGDRMEDLVGPAAEARPLVLPPGEETKSVAMATTCWEWLAERGARRDDVVVAVGGGVVGDLVGFVAATYLRGVELWQVPTSLLAQVDSSVGGKVAIDLPAGKNLVGGFHQPDLVVVDPDVLRTLPVEEFRAGLGEVVKYGLLDPEGLLTLLEARGPDLAAREDDVLEEVVRRCVAYKIEVVRADEEDRGHRAVLNLGHTAGHALEAALGFGVLPHGVAVGLGLLVALAVSEEVLGLPREVRRRTETLLKQLGLPVVVRMPPIEAVMTAAGHDKKLTAAGTGFVCLKQVGEPVWGVPVSAAVLRRALGVVRA